MERLETGWARNLFVAMLTVVACALTLWWVLPREVDAAVERSQTQVHRFWRLTGFPNGRPGYVVDHIIPLACGGPDHPLNMQWQTVEEGKLKDKTELECERYCPPFNKRVKE